MFGSFAVEMVVGIIMLLKHPLRFRFKPYISIPVGLLIPAGVTLGIIFVLYYTCPKYYPWNEFVNIITYTISLVSIAMSLWLTYKLPLNRVILVTAVAYTFQHMAYQLGIMIMDTGLNTALYTNLNQNVASIISTIISYVIKIGAYVLCYFFIARYYKKYSKHIIPTVGIIAVACLLYFVVNIANTFISLHLMWDPNAKAILGAALLVCCILFDSLIIVGFRIAERREENTIIQATLDARMKQYEMMETNMSFLNMKFHDLRKELKRIKKNNGQLTEEDFVLLDHVLSLYDSGVKTGNVNIDALIQDKLIYCKSVGIEFTALVDGGSFKDMTLADVYFLLTNIIDNAIEATQTIGDPDKRVINLTVSTKQGTIVIEQTNFTDKKLSFNSDGSIKTTKKNSKFHGYGTKSINYIVKKYDGVIDYNVSDGIFTLKIVI